MQLTTRARPPARPNTECYKQPLLVHKFRTGYNPTYTSPRSNAAYYFRPSKSAACEKQWN